VACFTSSTPTPTRTTRASAMCYRMYIWFTNQRVSDCVERQGNMRLAAGSKSGPAVHLMMCALPGVGAFLTHRNIECSKSTKHYHLTCTAKEPALGAAIRMEPALCER
jgi:hypothetical protein